MVYGVQWYQEGHSVEEMSKVFGFSEVTISKAIKNGKVSDKGLYTQTLPDGSTRSAYILGYKTEKYLNVDNMIYFYAIEETVCKKEFIWDSPVGFYYPEQRTDKGYFNRILFRHFYKDTEFRTPTHLFALDYCFNRDNLLDRYYGLYMLLYLEFYECYNLENRRQASKRLKRIFKLCLREIQNKGVFTEGNMVFIKGGSQTFILYPSEFYSDEFRYFIKGI